MDAINQKEAVKRKNKRQKTGHWWLHFESEQLKQPL